MTDLPMALGTMHFGTRTDEATAFDLLDAYVDAGGRWIDTANCYSFWQSESGSGGQSEAVIGRWLQARPAMRDRVLLSTKVGVEPTGEPSAPVEGLGAQVVAAGIRASLERLQCEHVDLFWAHGEDRSTPLHEVVAAFGAAHGDGLVRRIGFSNHPVWRVSQAHAIADRIGVEPPTALQQRWSYLQPRPGVPVEGSDHEFGMLTPETLDYAASVEGTDLWAYTPLLTGFYDRPGAALPPSYDHPGTHARLVRLTEQAQRLGLQRGQLVLSWMTHQQVPIRPIVGVSSLTQLKSAVDALRFDLPQDTLSELNADG